MSVHHRRFSCHPRTALGLGAFLMSGLLPSSLTALPVRADTLVAAISPSQPVVTVAAGGAGAAIRYDFGGVSLAAGNTLQRAYTLRNGGTAPVTIQGVTTSCGCTRVDLDAAGRTLSGRGPTVTGDPITLAPGQSVPLRLTVNISELHVGPIRKTVTVSGASDAAPLATIDLTATLLPGIVFTPQTIDFGAAAASRAHTTTLQATFDTRLIGSGQAPQLRSSDPAIRVGPPVVGRVTQGSQKTFSYQITLPPDAPIGPLTGRLYFAAPPKATPDDGQSLWSVGAGVTGQVVGDVSAAPAQVSLGTIPADTGGTATLKLTGKDAATLTGLRFTSDDPGVTARLRPDDPTTLEVRIAPHHRPGVMQTQVTILTHTGQRLLIPVVAVVQ